MPDLGALGLAFPFPTAFLILTRLDAVLFIRTLTHIAGRPGANASGICAAGVWFSDV